MSSMITEGPDVFYMLMKNILSFFVLACLFCSSSFAADWKSPADAAVGMPPAAMISLENKKDKSEQDIYVLTITYYREYQRAKLRKLFSDNKNNMHDSPAMKLLQGTMFLRDHRHQESRDVLMNIIKTHPDFYPAQVTLAHLEYLQKDFEGSYRRALQMIEKKSELSRFHLAMSLMLATGAKGGITKKHMIRAIPAYFEVNGYLKEAQKQMPDSAEVLYAVGSYHLLTPAIAGGDLDKAIVLLEKSRRMTPLNPSVYVRLAQAYRAKGQTAVSRKYIAWAIELDPQDEILLDDLSGQKNFLDVP
jgi:tetratricopeptide (TPR) repeat protein